MSRYYFYSPRGFSNEYVILQAATADEVKFCEALIRKGDVDPDSICFRITRKEAERRTARNRRAYRTGEVNIEPVGATRFTPVSDFILW